MLKTAALSEETAAAQVTPFRYSIPCVRAKRSKYRQARGRSQEFAPARVTPYRYFDPKSQSRKRYVEAREGEAENSPLMRAAEKVNWSLLTGVPTVGSGLAAIKAQRIDINAAPPSEFSTNPK